MLRFISLLILIFISYLGFAQDKMSTKLNNLVYGTQRSIKKQEVWLQFQQQLDYEKLDAEFRAKNYTNEQRAKAVIETSKAQHLTAMSYLKKRFKGVDVVEDFWLGNSVVISVDREEALALSYDDKVRWMELTSENLIAVEDVEMEKNFAEKDALNAAEPGLLAINAHKMWERGYTGKGRKALLIDTGVWPGHPAIADAWVGNRRPIDESWFGFDSPVPKDKGNSHGTHCIGTVLGLDPANNDTIGVAFDASFMAADPVATMPSERKGLYSTTRVFQWVLNPYDYSPTPDYKLPDVINNSWGRSTDVSPDICTNPIGGAIAACQLAGIAVVWSAGNNGPGTNTIGAPATITRNPYLVFTVGAIDGNNSNYPIAGFSSRGPSYCAKTGVDSIKPEVVAPGFNVRSAVGQDGYANYQGTSMAGPHVAGAVLLLKEAFPNLPGQDILEALYLTASDLGQPGEDINYGNGIIDVDSAFKWLVTKHTPVAPKVYSQDLVIDIVGVEKEGLLCDTENKIDIRIINNSHDTLKSGTLQYSMNAFVESNIFQKTIPNMLLPNDTLVFSEKVRLYNTTKQQLELSLVIPSSFDDNPGNNRCVLQLNTIGEGSIPLKDDFNVFYTRTADWLIDNPDNDHTWSIRVWEDEAKSNECLQLDFYNMNQRNQQQDFYVSPKLTIADNKKIQLSFDYAYATKHSSVFKDSLAVELTNTCNNNWINVWAKGGKNLSTRSDTVGLFVPKPTDWQNAVVDLTEYDDAEYLQIRFVGTNDFGNNLYIDNIELIALESASVQSAFQSADFKIYPNPNSGYFMIEGDLSSLKQIRVVDLSGKELKRLTPQRDIELSGINSGVYVVELISNETAFRHKVIIK